jgi:hypothetical protein
MVCRYFTDGRGLLLFESIIIYLRVSLRDIRILSMLTKLNSLVLFINQVMIAEHSGKDIILFQRGYYPSRRGGTTYCILIRSPLPIGIYSCIPLNRL